MAISSGVYSLAGVLIGGGITTSSQVYLAWRSERKDRIAEQRDLLIAKRQVSAELFQVGGALGLVAKGVSSANTLLPLLGKSEQWERHSSTLAHDECYLAVSFAYMGAATIAALAHAADERALRGNAETAFDSVAEALAVMGVDRVDPSKLPSVANASKARSGEESRTTSSPAAAEAGEGPSRGQD